jgi:hypothetical protein
MVRFVQPLVSGSLVYIARGKIIREPLFCWVFLRCSQNNLQCLTAINNRRKTPELNFPDFP